MHIVLTIKIAALLRASSEWEFAGDPWKSIQMYYETDKNNHGLRYNPVKACVVPRPIGWIASVNDAGLVNLAPFSFFNLLSYDPPFVMFSAGVHEADGGRKDTVTTSQPPASSSITWRPGRRRSR